MLCSRCKCIYKSYLPSAHKTQVEFRSHFLGKKVHLMGWEIRYTPAVALYLTSEMKSDTKQLQSSSLLQLCTICCLTEAAEVCGRIHVYIPQQDNSYIS